ncbi:MAG: D-alanine--D-alanine ligase [Magnetococcales bacterium]|nr:D-alanine--D-alanine ligase [Magnetococcales bacterium]MBF0150792.1 D-alanine--D-alanine ligase [Magnetococcales bacterium]MBF0348306.1 D-alanine--D-alanine ligase [Magnetococcales bacterium]MBF0631878.1 D-alanine--D-alanine ligase [Magnetococcales bacterium]
MRIGFVYDLRDDYLKEGFSAEDVVEFDTGDTLNHIEEALNRLGHEVERIGRGQQLARHLVQGRRWDAVFSIAEGLHGRSREAQVPAVLELFGQPYLFSDPLTMALTLDKAMAKRVVHAAGIPTAPWRVVSSMAEVASIDLPLPLFVKPLWEGTGKGCDLQSLVRDRDALPRVIAAKLERFRQPVLVETFLSGREFTVGLIGNAPDVRPLGVMEIHLNDQADAEVYTMTNKELSESRVSYRRVTDALGERIIQLGQEAFMALGCRDVARLDFRCDAAGNPHFLEANPLPGLHRTHSDLPIIAGLVGVSYDDLLGMILEAGRRRLE